MKKSESSRPVAQKAILVGLMVAGVLAGFAAFWSQVSEPSDAGANHNDADGAEARGFAVRDGSRQSDDQPIESNRRLDERLALARAKRAEEHALVVADKEEFLQGAPEDQRLSDTFKANPELYEEGPGKHFETYDRRSGALPVHAQPDDAKVTTIIDSDGPSPKLSVWVESYRVSADQDVDIHATLVSEQGAPVEPSSMSITIVERETQKPVEGVMSPAGNSWTYKFRPEMTEREVNGYEYVVYAVVEDKSGSPAVRTANGAFQVHSAVARVIKEEASVSQRDGNLVLKLPVLIQKPGNYTFYAELWGGEQGSVSVAFALERGENLPGGRYEPELLFGGLIIRDRAADGPFIIRNVRVRKVDQFPFAETDPIMVLMTTGPVAAESFGS